MPLKNGMPIYKYVANRALTMFENILVHYKLSEYHTGLRAFSKEVLNALNLESNSDDFIFDNQIIVQALAASCAHRRGSRCPTIRHADASSINFRRSMRYGLGVLKTSMEYPVQQVRTPALSLPRGQRPARSADRPRVISRRPRPNRKLTTGSYRLARPLPGPGTESVPSPVPD